MITIMSYTKNSILNISSPHYILYIVVSPCRYKVIVYSTVANRNGSKLWTTIVSLVAIWGISILLSFPLFLGMDLKVFNLNATMGPKVADFIFAHTGKLTSYFPDKYVRVMPKYYHVIIL